MHRSRWDRITPTEITLVSRAWVLDEVERAADLTEAQRQQLVDELVGYQPPRRNGMRNNLIVWFSLLGCTVLAGTVGLPPWSGFAAALAVLFVLARQLAVRTLRWRLAQRVEELRAEALRGR